MACRCDGPAARQQCVQAVACDRAGNLCPLGHQAAGVWLPGASAAVLGFVALDQLLWRQVCEVAIAALNAIKVMRFGRRPVDTGLAQLCEAIEIAKVGGHLGVEAFDRVRNLTRAFGVEDEDYTSFRFLPGGTPERAQQVDKRAHAAPPGSCGSAIRTWRTRSESSVR